jgi:hypothetical protein
MDSDLVERTRRQLRNRVEAVEKCPASAFPIYLAHLLGWVTAHPMLSLLLVPLKEQKDVHHARLKALFQPSAMAPTVQSPTSSWDDSVAFAWAALVLASELEFVHHLADVYKIVTAATGARMTQGTGTETAARELRAGPLALFHLYLDEQVDSRNVVLGLLRKYKKRCEWFRREYLRGIALNRHEGRTGEKALSFDLYEYLHDQTVDFSIEPATALGEPDLVGDTKEGQPLVVDAKYVSRNDKLKDTMGKGFRQVIQYLQDENEPVGYLVTFLACDHRPQIEGEADDGFPCFRLDNKTVYYVTIDIRQRMDTASKLQKPDPVVINKADLVALVRT